MPETGVVLWRANTTVPSGFLLCDGSAVSRTTYAALFTAIGTTYGAGDGSTTFNVPNLTSRYAVGANSPIITRGQTGGTINHTHTTNSHTHTVTQPGDHGTHSTFGDHTHDAHTTSNLSGGSGSTTLFNTSLHAGAGSHSHNSHTSHTDFATQSASGTGGAAEPKFVEMMPVVKT